MSLLALLRKKYKTELFTTPSHAQEFFVFPKLRQFYKYDISETDTHEPQKALELAQEKAAKIYGTKSTCFLTNGSSSGIIAAVLACVGAFHSSDRQKPQSRLGLPAQQQKGENETPSILIWNNAHPSHLNAVKLAGAEPVFYELEKDEEWGIYGATPVATIEKRLKNNKIKAVIVTSPSYEGVVSDIKKIKEICEKYGAFLIVDEAHGALYPFCDKLPATAIEKGADFVIQSLHKTAGGLNPTALLHCNLKGPLTPNPSPARGEGSTPQSHSPLQQALDMINTTSPSYPLLASIEKNINYLNSPKGRKKILELVKNIESMKKKLPNIEFYKENDPTKILIKAKNKTGYELSEYLFEHGIEDERTNEKSTMLLCGIGTSEKKLKRLEKILKLLK